LITDYIIIGQGIAGSVLAWELIQRGKKVLVLDPGENNASKIASGVITPITGRKYVKTWMANELIPFAVSYYNKIEKELNKNFLSSIPAYKLFYSAGNQNDWSIRAGSADYSSFLKNNKIEKLDETKVNNNFGSFQINNTYILNTNSFLLSLKDYFQNKNFFLQSTFDNDKIIFKTDCIEYENIKAGKIIFCEGYHGKFNKYFNYLPFNPAKGECLHVKIKDYYKDRIINGNYFTLPLEDDEYYLGSTNYWTFDDDLPTGKGKKELTDGLKSLTPLPFTITQHQSAIRPTVKDRKPFLGLHPHYTQLAIFNGMGTKGISLSPYFAAHFADFLLNKTFLQKDVDIQRFLS
jgi:glycine/D-amino acid oxidase-like deaminating enzyme